MHYPPAERRTQIDRHSVTPCPDVEHCSTEAGKRLALASREQERGCVQEAQRITVQSMGLWRIQDQRTKA